MKTPTALALAFLVLAGCSNISDPDQTSHPTIHPTVDSRFADPDKDVEQATAKGDFRFVGVMGYTFYLPGVPKDSDPGLYGTRVIEGTSDSPAGLEGERFNKAAREYAERYNKLLLKKITP